MPSSPAASIDWVIQPELTCSPAAEPHRAPANTITVDPFKGEYFVNSFTPTLQITDPSQTIVIEVESRDTGERRQLFGHSARHRITIERGRTEYP